MVFIWLMLLTIIVYSTVTDSYVNPEGWGALRYFFSGHVPPGTPNLDAVYDKIDTPF